MSKERLSVKNKLLQKFLLKVRPAFIASFVKEVFRVRRTVIEARDGYFFIDPVSQFGLILTQADEYEPSMRGTLENYLKPSSVFVDVGANEGYFSVVGSKLVGATGKVIAVEPQKRLQDILKKNLRLNHIENVVLIESAVSNTNGIATIHISPSINTGSTSLHQSTFYKLPREPVHTITLSELFSIININCVDLLKMDIEGSEYEAILGAPELFQQRRIKALALELHPRAIKKRGLNPEEITQFLEQSGYHKDSRFPNSVWTTKVT